jgi:uncharacterized protein
LSNQLIVFTRYPEPGKTKTRLIPLLGAVEAANLHRQMAEYTIEKVKSLQQLLITITIEFAGGNVQLMQDWLGDNLVYKPQEKGNLGERMSFAFKRAFLIGMTKVIIIGTDCPDLTENILFNAFNVLDYYDLVLGAAKDGGYYLIGLNRLIPQLFSGIDWGTSEVLEQTQTIAKKLNLTVKILPFLSDVDRPEDLPIWQRIIAQKNQEL